MKNKLNLPELESKKVFAYFEELAAIPHGSRNTRQISDYLISFAKEHGLECYQDEANNVVIIQEHLPDMKVQTRSSCRDIWIWSVRRKKAWKSILRKTVWSFM